MTEQEKESENGRTEEVPKKQYISNDDLYRRSSQFELWSFTQESLEAKKKQANEIGRRIAKQRFDEAYNKLKQENPTIFEIHKQELDANNLITLLSHEEETKFIHAYCQNIVQTADYFRMPTQVKLTAISLFKKFYLENSIMEYHPKNIMYTSVFLAAKSENYFITIESFISRLKDVKQEDILDLEFKILESLKFTLLVHHAFRPLYGFFLDFQAILLHPSPVMYDVSIDTLGSLYDRAKKWLNEYAILSDVAFLFTPPQIALAAMYAIDRRITERYLKEKFLDDHTVNLESIPEHNDDVKEEDKDNEALKASNESSNQREYCITLIRTIRKCIKLSKLDNPTPEESKEIGKRCKAALNPDKVIERRVKKLAAPTTTTTNTTTTTT
ncbi:cyclin-like protein [Scheffersomyces amazonensis]|uniref:cyclin-like protein n=1 Tax=Scheffersomyces amazonensis TaxID=1078765 RepID=UPI00315C7AAE